MFRSPLKVYGEYLIPKAAAEGSMTGSNSVRAGKSMSGLEIVVCAEASDADPEVGLTVAAGTSVTIRIKQSQDGEVFIALPDCAKSFDEESVFLPGEILARMTLPSDCLLHIKGDLAFSAAPEGNVSMFPAYLPR